MIVRLLIALVILLQCAFADFFNEGEKEYARAQYEKAALSFERFYLLNPASDSATDALYKSAQAYFFSGANKPKNRDRALGLLDKILIIQEPEDPYYYRAILFKIHILLESKEIVKAEELYRTSAHYATVDEQANSNLLCFQIYKNLGDSVKSSECLKKIELANGMTALYTGVQDKKVQVAKRPAVTEVAKKREIETGTFSIQVGAFSSKTNAEGLKNAYADLGREVTVKESKREKGTLFLVWVGKFENKKDAEIYAHSHIADKEPKFRVVSIN